ncbi:MAG TPA: prephenate dehydratase [Anaerolinea thermolimosa]|uniref:Prephenate dehydratase n=1 Tax=Anaerolinea thermolimosa TaxID=229919 RepID=A0A3D1JJZ4_9CHLR|nr:prephenate dehydratase [Anaerolinea thermolimosa]GAP07733.1 prephenate dehydratase [Anaerolinea thermolimosa]HCE17956.1 prephenate dehydratase [Anaerolinea thermolimosa]
MRVAFQGEHGAYSEAAIIEHYGEGVESIPCESFEVVFASVADGRADLGFLPIENSLAGSIHRNYDLLLQHDLVVVGEHSLRVSHCLIGLPGTRLEEIRTVTSHPQALAQCEGTLKRMGVKVEPAYDTAGSVRLVRQAGERSVAAIAARRAAQIYEMEVLAEAIEDNPANFTRFLIVGRQPVSPGSDAKTSIVFSLDNRPGALYRAMSVFALRDIDLTKIESRPLAGKPWEYLFYIDFAGSIEETPVKNALANLAEFATFLRVLGSYPRFRG